MREWKGASSEQLGLAIAAVAKITHKGSVWLVPAQSRNKHYTVCPDPKQPHCTCPDHETTGAKCKHIHAVEFLIRREENPDGDKTVTEIPTVAKRKTYPQNWPTYNAAQTNEKHRFQELLFDLCLLVENPPQQTGRRRIPLGEAIFAATFRVYSTVSARRFMSDLRDAHERGYISKVPHFNSILNYLDNPAMTPVLRDLITVSSLPMAAIETHFAADSTGFTTSRFVAWFDKKYRAFHQREHDWVKLHLMCGVVTNIVTTAEIHERDASDTIFLPSLLAKTAQYFRVREVSADKGYSSAKNHEAIVAAGATPYIPFKSNATGRLKNNTSSRRAGIWEKAFYFFSLHREEFLARYHRRSNVETTMSMIKAKFRDDVRSRNETAMMNEVYCKVLCHNICCLIQAIYELGIEPEFQALAA